MKRSGTLLDDAEAGPRTHPEGGLASPNRNPTTSFLTATTLIYAIGAGITAAAGALTSQFTTGTVWSAPKALGEVVGCGWVCQTL